MRNVALVGHAGAGKTTLAEALLVATGALPRAGRVEEGTTCLDTEEVEVRQQRSVSLGVATVEHQDHRITLLDTPGSPDFVGELRAGLRAADAALFVVSAVNGVDATTEQLWAGAPPSACRGRSSSPSWTGRAPTSRTPSGSASASSATASSRCTCSTAARTARSWLVSLLEPHSTPRTPIGSAAS